MQNLQSLIEQAWENRALLQETKTTDAIRAVIELLDAGKLRVAEPVGDTSTSLSTCVKGIIYQIQNYAPDIRGHHIYLW